MPGYRLDHYPTARVECLDAVGRERPLLFELESGDARNWALQRRPTTHRRRRMRLHGEFGWEVACLPILVLLLAWPARVGRRTVWLCVALFVMGSVAQPSLPGLGDQFPRVAALHKPNALLVFFRKLRMRNVDT